jgi:acetyl esterase/lipase
MQYTLYPDALVPQLVQEVSAAFDWALENVGSYGGDAKKVRLARLSLTAGNVVCWDLRSSQVARGPGSQP